MGRALALLALLGACTGSIGDPMAGETNGVLPPGAFEPPLAFPDTPFSPVAPVVRRLTHAELVFTLEDLLGEALPADAVATLPEVQAEGFETVATGQSVSEEQVFAFQALARAAVTTDGFARLASGAGCTDTGMSCGVAVADALALPLFRRPLDDRERALFSNLFRVVAEEADLERPFARAAEAVGEAMLQSPPFLYLLEDERSGQPLRGYAMAARLSYLVWKSGPDDALLAAAAAGELDAPAGVLAALERMLDDPRTSRVHERFLVDWARLAKIPDDDGLKGELLAGAAAFYAAHASADDDLLRMIDDPSAMLTPALAEAYGLEASGDGMQRYDLTDVPGRGGLLAQPGVIAGMTNADGGAIVARGLFLQRQLFCGEAPDPPDTLQDAIDAFVEELPEDATYREIAEVRLARPECGACHADFDPIAYGFEAFDFRGGHRTLDTNGEPVRVDGWIPQALAGRPIPFGDYDELVQSLARSPRVRRCLTRRILEHALGATLGEAQDRAVAEITDAAEASGGSWRAIVRALVVHDLFRTRETAE